MYGPQMAGDELRTGLDHLPVLVDGLRNVEC